MQRALMWVDEGKRRRTRQEATDSLGLKGTGLDQGFRNVKKGEEQGDLAVEQEKTERPSVDGLGVEPAKCWDSHTRTRRPAACGGQRGLSKQTCCQIYICIRNLKCWYSFTVIHYLEFILRK